MDKASNPNLYGKGALGSQDKDVFRFVLILSDLHQGKIITLYNTIAHELGHAIFDLEHPFHQSDISSKGYIEGTDPANFMDYQDGTESRKYQWKDMQTKIKH